MRVRRKNYLIYRANKFSAINLLRVQRYPSLIRDRVVRQCRVYVYSFNLITAYMFERYVSLNYGGSLAKLILCPRNNLEWHDDERDLKSSRKWDLENPRHQNDNWTLRYLPQNWIWKTVWCQKVFGHLVPSQVNDTITNLTQIEHRFCCYSTKHQRFRRLCEIADKSENQSVISKSKRKLLKVPVQISNENISNWT